MPVTFATEPRSAGNKGEEQGWDTVSFPEQPKEMGSDTAASYTADFVKSPVWREATL